MLRVLVMLMLAAGISYGQIAGTSGTLEGGETVVISGSSFGTKATAAPVLWEDFEDGVDGSSLASTGYWGVDYDPAGSLPVFSTANERVTGSQGARSILTALGAQDCFFKSGLPLGDNKYWSYWLYYSEPALGDPWQVKLVSIAQHVSSGGSTTIPGWLFTTWHNANYFVSYGLPSNNVYGVSPVNDAWNFYEFEIEEGTAGVQDGLLRVWKNGDLVYNSNTVQHRNLETEVLDSFKFGQYVGNSTIDHETTLYYDDIYIDSTRARVIIGDASDLENCTHHEIQIPTDWEPDEITITFNQGAFVADDAAYIFVVDTDGTPSAGYPITIGGEASVELTAPSNLTSAGGNP